jgi:hypothetical protein
MFLKRANRASASAWKRLSENFELQKDYMWLHYYLRPTKPISYLEGLLSPFLYLIVVGYEIK